MVRVPDGRAVEVLDVSDDEFGRAGEFRPRSSLMTE
jgi:hypothetical protein